MCVRQPRRKVSDLRWESSYSNRGGKGFSVAFNKKPRKEEKGVKQKGAVEQQEMQKVCVKIRQGVRNGRRH